MDGWIDGWIDGWVDGWVDGWMDRRMSRWEDGQVDGQMDGNLPYPLQALHPSFHLFPYCPQLALLISKMTFSATSGKALGPRLAPEQTRIMIKHKATCCYSLRSWHLVMKQL